MSQQADFRARSYAAHETGFSDYARNGSKADHGKAWLDPESINTWRFNRMYRLADPLLEACPGARWLTVGDGRYGMDAMYLMSHGANVLATDISDTLLSEAKAERLIDDFRKENAEELSFPDASFDFVLCKESYHHFPRPMKALYEMLRIAKQGVVLIEPNDPLIPHSGLTTCSRLLKTTIKKLLGRRADHHDFEEIGNYVYTLSQRELEKVVLGLGLFGVAFKGMNDYYLPGVEFEPAREESRLFRKIRSRIALYDRLCSFGISQYGLLGTVLLVSKPSDQVLTHLLADGFVFPALPRNPHA